ncbi:PaaI family thioesterase [Breoghania sp. L-A4]|uniref:PaaI family thioesterase n=1 Tax=Breoghania sp. L-A4 TaxID=2304600 RepID=UPI000E35D960|nr:PaaI family thioesterase [Breoghania sp. L-A4]AXS40838.1 PaaI family thioesterase [Breoghania sp. L-A4]
MSVFEPRDPDWEARVRASFGRQPFMEHLGARIVHLAPGEVDLAMAHQPALTQQHGFFHAGSTASIADSAAGYAALSLYPPGTGVLTTEYKINLLNPARGDQLVARGRVIKPGRTLTICRADVFGLDDARETHVATALFSMICLEGMAD